MNMTYKYKYARRAYKIKHYKRILHHKLRYIKACIRGLHVTICRTKITINEKILNKQIKHQLNKMLKRSQMACKWMTQITVLQDIASMSIYNKKIAAQLSNKSSIKKLMYLYDKNYEIYASFLSKVF